ncbi:MAG: hypothetical protein N2A97_01045 [Thermodesulfobacteriales bacterium]
MRGCSSSNNGGVSCPDTTIDLSVCDPPAGPFSIVIDNEFFPLFVGDELVLEGEEDGEVLEISRNFFVQAPDGTACYYGEDVDVYEDGIIVDHPGEWRAGENGNLPGIQMPANPKVGDIYAQDQAEVVALGETITVPAETFSDTLITEECNPLDNGALDDKAYVSGIGLAIDANAELISF